MINQATKRQRKLLGIAQEDMIYQAWDKSFAQCRDAFAQFANSQPEDIRSILYAYADCGRMAQQRLVNIACEQMIFPDEENK